VNGLGKKIYPKILFQTKHPRNKTKKNKKKEKNVSPAIFSQYVYFFPLQKLVFKSWGIVVRERFPKIIGPIWL